MLVDKLLVLVPSYGTNGEGRRGLPGDRPRGAHPRPPDRERRGGDARRRHGEDAAAEIDRGSAPACPRAQRPRAAATRGRLPPWPRARRVRAARHERGRPRHLRLAVPRAARPGYGRDGERRDPDPGRRRSPRPGRLDPPPWSRELGRQPDPDPRVVPREGVHGVRGRPAPLRPARAARARDDHHHERAAGELDQVRRAGYATTWEELEAGLCSTAAPVRGARGTVIAAISVSAPTVRTSRERLAELSAQVVDTADALSDHIQHRHDPGDR